jgi:hypothetical protein
MRRVSAIWDAYLRDAGAGDVGRNHVGSQGALLSTSDPRRDGILLWLVDHARPGLAAAAATAARTVGAERRLAKEALDHLAIAIDMLPKLPEQGSPASVERWLWSYVERLRAEPDFTEAAGEAFEIALPEARFSGYRAASPGACWAANLALQARVPATMIPVPPGIFSRILFRLDLDGDERAWGLRSAWLRGLDRAEAALFEVDRELARGAAALVGLSKNARAGEAWSFIAGFGGLTRAQLARGLSLSRGGAGLIAQQLVDADLIRIDAAGMMVRADAPPTSAGVLDKGVADAATAVDEALAEIDRLLVRSSYRQPTGT